MGQASGDRKVPRSLARSGAPRPGDPMFSQPPPGDSLSAIERPRCRRCHSRMKLVSISAGPTGYEQRAFECPKCDHAETSMAPSDPMKSKAAGWLCSDLKPPD